MIYSIPILIPIEGQEGVPLFSFNNQMLVCQPLRNLVGYGVCIMNEAKDQNDTEEECTHSTAVLTEHDLGLIYLAAQS